MIRHSADALLRLLNDILDFSKIEAGKLELQEIHFNLRDCVGQTMRTLGIRAAKKELELACRIAPELPNDLTGDPGRLRQIIVNLVGNAIKFTNTGEVVIDVTPAKGPAQDGRVVVRFSVKDTGVGIPAEKRAKVFEAFDQADASTTRRYGDSGLGLAISSQLVEMMNGLIWVDSEVGKGTTFYFTAEFGVLDAATKPDPTHLSSLRGLRALIVDDNETNRRILDEVLRLWEMRSVSVDNAISGLDELSKAIDAADPFDLVLLDCMMPDVDGLEFAARVRADPRLKTTKLLMVSSAGPAAHAEECRKLDIARQLAKPVIQSELLDALLYVTGSKQKPDADSSPPVGQAARAGPKLKVIIAEDGLINQQVAAGFVRVAGHEVVVAGSGKRAIIAWEKGGVDLILMDIQMPELDGFAATQIIRKMEQENDRRTPIIAMTAHAMKGDREKCLEAGMDGYIAKPIEREELSKILEEFGAKKRGVPTSTVNSSTADAAANQANLFDIETALARIPGGMEAVRQMVPMLASEFARQRQVICDGLKDRDAKTVQRGAHTIKGAADVFAAKHVVAVHKKSKNVQIKQILQPPKNF